MFNFFKKNFNFELNSQEEKVRNIFLIFLLILWFINPSNKLIVLSFLILLCILVYLTKKLDISLLLIYLLSSFFSVGKTYYIQISDLKQFFDLISLYPIGLVTAVQISVSDVFFALLMVFSVIVFFRRKINLKKIEPIDLVLALFFFYGILADIIVSNNLPLSLLLKKELFELIFVYFVIKFTVKDHQLLYRLFLSLLISLTLFEVFIALQQFIYSSPVGKRLEATSGIEAFGQGADETYFVFRPLGTFFHANYFAMFLTAILPFFTFLIIKSKELFIKIMYFLVIVSLILTLSRAAWLASFISILLILFYLEYQKKILLIRSMSIKKIALYLLLIVPLLIYSAPRIIKIQNIFDEGGGLNLRTKQASEIKELISQSPFFGTGTGLSVIKAMEKNPKGVFSNFPSPIHNYFLLIAVENGLPYLGFFILFLFLSIKKLFSYGKVLAFFSIVGIIAVIIVGLFQPFFVGRFLLIILGFDYDKITEDYYDH